MSCLLWLLQASTHAVGPRAHKRRERPRRSGRRKGGAEAGSDEDEDEEARSLTMPHGVAHGVPPSMAVARAKPGRARVHRGGNRRDESAQPQEAVACPEFDL